MTDPLGLDPWWKKPMLGEDGKPNGRFYYQEAANSPGEGWDKVDFTGTFFQTARDIK